MAQESRKSELIAQLALARGEASASVRGLSRDLNVVHRAGASFQKHRLFWLGGAGVLGLLLSQVAARPKKVVVNRRAPKSGNEEKVVKAGLLITLLKIAFDLARPVLTKWVARKVSDYASARFGSGAVR